MADESEDAEGAREGECAATSEDVEDPAFKVRWQRLALHRRARAGTHARMFAPTHVHACMFAQRRTLCVCMGGCMSGCGCWGGGRERVWVCLWVGGSVWVGAFRLASLPV